MRKPNTSVLAAPAEQSLKPDFAPLHGVARIAIGVSGGSDSMALLLLLVDWAKAQPLMTRISVLTVDHGLRAQSAFEAETVGSWAKQLGLEHHVLPWLGEKPSTGIQAKARAMRYELMTGWCRQNNVPVLLTAHTQDDQTETVLMRQARTSSVRSLAGIWPAREWNGIKILRPVLQLRRMALREFLRSRGQGWLDDPSNDNRRFERVRVRQDMDAGQTHLALEATGAQAEVRLAQEQARGWCASHLSVSDLGVAVCAWKRLVDVSPLAADEVLLTLLSLTGRRVAPLQAERRHVLEWLNSGQLGRRTLGGAIFVKRKAQLLVAREAGRISPEPVTIPPAGQITWDGRFLVTGPMGAVMKPLRDWGDLTHRTLPQFVRLGLPAAFLAGKLAFVPQLQPNPLFSYELITREAQG